MNAMPAISDTGRESLGSDQIAAFLGDPETKEAVRAVVAERWPNAVLNDGGLPAALAALSQNPSPEMLIVDVSGSDDPNAGARSLLALCDPATRVIAIGTINDINYYRDLTELGISEYLVKPVVPETLAGALGRPDRPRPVLTPVEDGSARDIISVIGARGGLGATTLAVNMAWIASHELNRSCTIIDLDLQFGTVGLQLDLEPSQGLREALENPDRIDALFIASAMANESENLYVLSAEEPFDESVSYTAEACETLIGALPEDLQHVFLDIPARSAVENPSLLSQSQKIVLVSDLSLVGMRDIARLARVCREAAPDAALHTVVNRAGMAAKGEIPKAEFAKGTDLPVRHFIPFDAKVAALASVSGKAIPEISTRSPTARAIRKLVDNLVQPDGRGAKANALDGLRKILRSRG